jgi:transposase InsO family protein
MPVPLSMVSATQLRGDVQCLHTGEKIVQWASRIYGAVVTRRLRAMGIRDQPIAPASPWQNGFVERLIGSIRRERVDHIIVLGEAHLRRT